MYVMCIYIYILCVCVCMYVVGPIHMCCGSRYHLQKEDLNYKSEKTKAEDLNLVEDDAVFTGE